MPHTRKVFKILESGEPQERLCPFLFFLKWFIINYLLLFSVDKKPPRHRFGLSRCPGLAINQNVKKSENQITMNLVSLH